MKVTFSVSLRLFLLWLVSFAVVIGLKLDGPLHRWEWLWALSPLWGFGALGALLMFLALLRYATK